MKNDSCSNHPGAALAGLVDVFRRAAHADVAQSKQLHHHEQTRQVERPDIAGLGARLGATLTAYTELEGLVRKRLNSKLTLPDIALDLLGREVASASDLAQVGAFFEELQRQQMISSGVGAVTVPLVGRLYGSKIEIDEYQPGPTGAGWIPRAADPARNPDIWQVLEYVTDATTPVKIELTWIGTEHMEVRHLSTAAWSEREYLEGDRVRGTRYTSTLLLPFAGRVGLTMHVATPTTIVPAVVSDYQIRVDLGHSRGGPVVEPTPVLVPVSEPTPPWLPNDFTTLDPHEREALRERFADFLRDTVQVYRGLLGTARLTMDVGLVRAVLEQAAIVER